MKDTECDLLFFEQDFRQSLKNSTYSTQSNNKMLFFSFFKTLVDQEVCIWLFLLFSRYCLFFVVQKVGGTTGRTLTSRFIRKACLLTCHPLFLHQITVDLKNDIKIKGTLKSVDQYLNLKLDNIEVDTTKYPHFIAIKNLFLRGTNIRYIHLNPAHVDTNLLQDASRREAMAGAGEKIAGRQCLTRWNKQIVYDNRRAKKNHTDVLL